MMQKTIFIELFRSIDSSNASRTLEKLELYLKSASLRDVLATVVVRHLETLSFQFEGNGQFANAAKVYELIIDVCPQDRPRWWNLAVNARLHDLVERACWMQARAVIADIKQKGGFNTAIKFWVSKFLELGWDNECNYLLEAATQCYRLAFELNDGDAGIETSDGIPVSTKVRNIRVLQMNELAEAGQHEEAATLHEQTRAITGLNRVGIYNILSARQAAANNDGDYREVLPSRRIAGAMVKFFGDPVTITSEAGSLDAPAQYVAFFKNCLTFPRSNLVIRGEHLIYDLAAHPRSAVAEIRDGVNPDQIFQAVYGTGRALIEIPDKVQKFDAGLMLFGFQSRNYGHWLLEFAPRILWFNHPACPSDFPIYIDEDMPITHRQIIEMMDDRNRAVVAIRAFPTQFGKLGVAPVPAFFPFDMRAGQQVYDTVWPSDILRSVRKKILDSTKSKNKPLRHEYRRLFISRRDFAQRRLVNELEIEKLLLDHGFVTIQPERMSLLEQVMVFNSAEIIIGSASSALTNCLFCRPGANVIALIHENTSFNFRGYTSMIESSGATLTFIRGSSVKNQTNHPFHADYTVNAGIILKAIANINRL